MARSFRKSYTTLTEANLKQGLQYLAEKDADLARILAELGSPPMWSREQGFPTLIHIILEQQVSLASAAAAFNRLTTIASPLTPQRFLEFDDDALKRIGFSRQKIIYGRELAQAIVEGHLNLEALNAMDDAQAKSELMRIKGIGAWTADIYLLRAMNRADAWPAGDLALAIAAQQAKRLSSRPTPLELESMSESWRPFRAVAARLLWHYYLHKPARLSVAAKPLT